MSERPTIALIGEARGEFMFLRMVADGLRERLGPGSVIQIEMDPLDLSAEERESCLVPQTEPAFRAMMALPASELPARVAEAERRFGVPNLRRLWRADLQYWRDGVGEEELARQALGYLEVFDRLYRDHPGLVGGFAEESARLIKRAFRAVSLCHGRRMLIDIAIPLLGRTMLVDQEDFDVSLPPYTEFEPTLEELERAKAHVEELRSGQVNLANPRDYGLSWKRAKNFGVLVWKAATKRNPGDSNAHPWTFARDYVRQRARLGLINRIAETGPQGEPAVFYPWHFAADSNVTVRGEPYRNQLLLIEHLAGSLPYGYKLWIKPHPACAGELPLSRLIALKRRLGNIRLIHPSIPARGVLRESDAVVTLSSTAGFEALLLGIPVITLGRSYFRGRGLTYDVTDLDELHSVLPRALAEGVPNGGDVRRLLAYYVHVTRDLRIIGEDPSVENAERYVDALIDEFELSADRAEKVAS